MKNERKSNFLPVLLAGLFFLCGARQARAAIVASHTFENDLHGWYSEGGWATVANPLTGGIDDSGWMSTTWDELFDPDPGSDGWNDIFKTPSANLLATGEWTTNMFFETQFWASNNAPEAVQIMWGSSASGRTWRNTVFDDVTDNMNVQSWTRLVSDGLDDYTKWKYATPDYNEANFLDDLANIDWVGMRIFRGDMAADVYGIDDFSLMIPEPAELVLLLAVGLCSYASARRKKRSLQSVE